MFQYDSIELTCQARVTEVRNKWTLMLAGGELAVPRSVAILGSGGRIHVKVKPMAVRCADETLVQNATGKYHLQILSRAINVLFAFSTQEPSLSLDTLSTRLRINKASLLRILRTFEAEKLLIRSGEEYRLGPRVLSLSNVYLSTLSVHSTSKPHLERLAESCQQTVSLAILEDLEIVYIAIEHAQREVGIQGEIGARHPANATALGKVLLSGLDDEELAERLTRKSLPRLTHRTIVHPDELIAHIRHVRSRGYALDDEERGIGIRCVAAPIYDHNGRIVAGISLAGPIFHMTDEAIARFIPEVKSTAQRISLELGYLPEQAPNAMAELLR